MFHVKQSGMAYDIIVIGAGHAGCEAAHAAHRMGAKVALVTHRFDRIGEMSCNPAMGGLGKGHLIREVDALDGLIARASDAAGLQFRVLNRSRGPAVRGPRVQCDRDLYRSFMQAEIAAAEGVTVIEGEAIGLLLSKDSVCGIEMADGAAVTATKVVLTAGTFLQGVIHIGDERRSAGRVGDAAAIPLARQLNEAGFTLGRLKTGTPPRLDGATVAWTELDEQEGDATPEPLSMLTEQIDTPQLSCFVSATTEETHKIIHDNLDKSAMYAGYIKGVGPRYCPSIEDKIVRFKDRSSHNVFLEPETRSAAVIYPNGVSTSLPRDTQQAFVRSMKGLQNAEILQYGYAIEYDFIDPRDVYPTLETKKINGLYLAGQIIGTTGYEEAAALGLIAAVNAVLALDGSDPYVPTRDRSYMGVMVDDLTRVGVTEPYRMFTSRAEYRLTLRADNADQRLSGDGERLGLLTECRKQAVAAFLSDLDQVKQQLEQSSVTPHEASAAGVTMKKDGGRRSLLALLSHPDMAFSDLSKFGVDVAAIPSRVQSRLEADAVYQGFIDRQQQEIADLTADDHFSLPKDLDFSQISALSAEEREKLARIKPMTLGQARRIEGVTPAAIISLMPYAKRSARG